MHRRFGGTCCLHRLGEGAYGKKEPGREIGVTSARVGDSGC